MIKARIPTPWERKKCCGLLKTRSLLDALAEGGYGAAFGGARRDEESPARRARISPAIHAGAVGPKNQRPELESYNSRHHKGESIRVFPLSNWTEMDVWQYIHAENISIVPLYYAKEREAVVRGNSVILMQYGTRLLPGEKTEMVKCCMRSLGCTFRAAARSRSRTRIRFRKLSMRWFPSGGPNAKILRDRLPRRRRLDGD